MPPGLLPGVAQHNVAKVAAVVRRCDWGQLQHGPPISPSTCRTWQAPCLKQSAHAHRTSVASGGTFLLSLAHFLRDSCDHCIPLPSKLKTIGSAGSGPWHASPSASAIAPGAIECHCSWWSSSFSAAICGGVPACQATHAECNTPTTPSHPKPSQWPTASGR